MMKKSKQYEAGSIMLEVVAVLALMGVMGAMLFRQIYQRNQELHNIQMASEIRTVKEAFSAYIQANRSSILATNCTTIPSSDDVVQCTGGNFDDIYDGVAYYLPDGWFDGEDLEGAYTLSLWNYLIENDSEKRIVYGIVVPTTDTLPTTGWNFKRAARVALLIGADGGAYDPTITKCSYNNSKECIAGALGAWEIESSGIFDADTYPDGTYVATTGIDLFAPEYELPEGKVGIPAEWNLALQNLHAYSYFSVGNAGDSDCYSIETDTTPGGRSIRKYDGAGENAVVESDTVSPGLSDDCKPLFWVGSEIGGVNASSGNVYVATDLKIGDIIDDAGTKKHNEALTLTKEGVIKQKDGLIIDADGRIIAKDGIGEDAVGELPAGEKYVLDPAHISTMGDIRLTSRGGVKLSDILPNYILKNTYTASCTLTKGKGNSTSLSAKSGSDKSWCDTSATSLSGGTAITDIPLPDCPKGYSPAAVVYPSIAGKASIYLDETEKITSTEYDGHTHEIPEIKSCSFFVYIKDSSGRSSGAKMVTNAFKVIMGYRKEDEGSNNPTFCPNNTDTESLHAVVQTYCVYNGTGISVADRYTSKNDCESAGLTWDTSVAHCSDAAYTINSTCTNAGKTWIEGYCKSVYSVDNINNHVSSNKKAATCKAAGYKWDGATCSDS